MQEIDNLIDSVWQVLNWAIDELQHPADRTYALLVITKNDTIQLKMSAEFSDGSSSSIPITEEIFSALSRYLTYMNENYPSWSKIESTALFSSDGKLNIHTDYGYSD